MGQWPAVIGRVPHVPVQGTLTASVAGGSSLTVGVSADAVLAAALRRRLASFAAFWACSRFRFSKL